MTEEISNLPKGPNMLVITGRGRVLEATDNNTLEYVGAVTSDLKVFLGGKDVTDKIKTVEDLPGFMSYKMCKKFFQAEFGLSEDGLSLPPSVFELPEDVNLDKIELIKVDRDFIDFYEGGIWVDYLFYDGEEYQADSLWDNDYYGGDEEDGIYNNNDWYSLYQGGPETKICRL